MSIVFGWSLLMHLCSNADIFASRLEICTLLINHMHLMVVSVVYFLHYGISWNSMYHFFPFSLQNCYTIFIMNYNCVLSNVNYYSLLKSWHIYNRLPYLIVGYKWAWMEPLNNPVKIKSYLWVSTIVNPLIK